MTVSNIDGRIPWMTPPKYQTAVAFGGRGFSVWDGDDFSLVYDSGDEIEKKTALLFYNVFNSDISTSTYTYMSPENMKDSASGTKVKM